MEAEMNNFRGGDFGAPLVVRKSSCVSSWLLVGIFGFGLLDEARKKGPGDVTGFHDVMMSGGQTFSALTRIAAPDFRQQPLPFQVRATWQEHSGIDTETLTQQTNQRFAQEPWPLPMVERHPLRLEPWPSPLCWFCELSGGGCPL